MSGQMSPLRPPSTMNATIACTRPTAPPATSAREPSAEHAGNTRAHPPQAEGGGDRDEHHRDDDGHDPAVGARRRDAGRVHRARPPQPGEQRRERGEQHRGKPDRHAGGQTFGATAPVRRAAEPPGERGDDERGGHRLGGHVAGRPRGGREIPRHDEAGRRLREHARRARRRRRGSRTGRPRGPPTHQIDAEQRRARTPTYGASGHTPRRTAAARRTSRRGRAARWDRRSPGSRPGRALRTAQRAGRRTDFMTLHRDKRSRGDEPAQHPLSVSASQTRTAFGPPEEGHRDRRRAPPRP